MTTTFKSQYGVLYRVCIVMQKTKNDANRHLGNVVAMGRSRGMLILTVLKRSNRVVVEID